ncbi:MAG: homoserine O-acetyltransferase [Alphaproteobacteria bacterium]|nr:homoserine O-acetyltransferase [Alphaproteobacteria bacterium]
MKLCNAFLPARKGLFITGLLITILLCATTATPLQAADLLTTKKIFQMPSYGTVSGKALKNVAVGYETYGTLNAKGDNAIFVAHFFSGTSHAAGKYSDTDKATGYWDSIIGEGKAIDTRKFYVISADTLSNLNTKDPNVTTTGPSSINPDTGKPYGMAFPIISYKDSVRVHKALLDQLGVKHLYAVAGASGGSIQAMEWAVLYPEFVDRVIHVIGPGFAMPSWSLALLEAWSAPITADTNWNNGDYYGKVEPLAGVAQSLKLVTLTARNWGWADANFGNKLATEGKNPADSMDNKFAIEATLVKAGAARAVTTDANNFLYMTKANQLYNVEADISKIKAKILFIPAKSDLVFPPQYARAAYDKFKAMGKSAEYFELDGSGGHLDGLFIVNQAAEIIRKFLAN